MKKITLLLSIVLLLSCTSSKKPESIIEIVKEGNITKLKNSITAENINKPDETGATPLMWAAFKGDIDTVKFLVEKGADPEKMGLISVNDDEDINVSSTPLLAAVSNSHFEVIKYLVENAGVDINKKGYCINHFLIRTPAEIKDFDKFYYFVLNSKGKLFTLIKNTKEFSCISEAPLEAQPYFFILILNDLINKYDLKNDVMDQNGCRRISENRKIIDNTFKDYITPYGDYNCIKNENGKTALYDTVYRGKEEIVKYLISKGATVNVKDCYGMSPVFAINKNKWEITSILLKNGADRHARMNFIKEDNEPILSFLLVNESYPSSDKKALKKGLRKVLPLLWKSKEDVVESCRDTQINPLVFSCKSGNEEIVQIMLDNGADYSMKYKGKEIREICMENKIYIESGKATKHGAEA